MEIMTRRTCSTRLLTLLLAKVLLSLVVLLLSQVQVIHGTAYAAETTGYTFRRGLPLFPSTQQGKKVDRGTVAEVGIVASEFSGIVPNGGVGTFYTALAQELAAAGHRVTLLYTQGTRSHSAVGDFDYWKNWYQGYNITLLPVHFVPRYGSSYHASVSFEAYLQLKRLNERAPFDVIHFPDWQGHGYYTLLSKYMGSDFDDTTLCVMTHGPLRWARLGNGETLYDPSDIEVDFMERQTIKLADILLSPSEYLITWIKQQNWQVPKDEFVHIQPYLTPDVTPAEAGSRNADGLIDEIVFFGRWEARKGIKTFCDGVNDLLADLVSRDGTSIKFKVTFMGSDRGKINGISSADYVENCISQWRSNTVEGKPFPLTEVSLQSSLNSFQAHSYLQQTNCIAVLPSLFENSPLSIFELISMKVPFLASSAGGIPELVHPECRNKTIFDAGSAAQLKEKLLQSLGLPSKMLFVKGMYDPQSVLEQWVRWHELKAQKTCHDVSEGDATVLEKDEISQSNHDILLQPDIHTTKAFLANRTEELSLCLVLDGDEESIEETLESIVAQEMKGYEILLWRAGGSGSSETFLRERGFTSIQKVEFNIKAGLNYIAEAQNACIQQASGSHILFLQSGHILMQDAISQLWRASLLRGLDITTSFMSLYTRSAGRARRDFTGISTQSDSFHVHLSGRKTYPFVFLGRAPLPGLYQNVFGGPLMIVRMEALSRVGPFNTDLGGGYSVWEFYSRAAFSQLSMEVLPKGLYLSPMKQGYTRSPNDKQIVEQVIGHYLRTLPQQAQTDVISMKAESIPLIADLA